MDLAFVAALLLAIAGVSGLAYLGGREKEKRDVLLAIRSLKDKYPSDRINRVDPSTVVWSMEEMINSHTHRYLGRRSHYDERRSQHAGPA